VAGTPIDYFFLDDAFDNLYKYEDRLAGFLRLLPALPFLFTVQPIRFFGRHSKAAPK
jgi:hypothetical protein